MLTLTVRERSSMMTSESVSRGADRLMRLRLERPLPYLEVESFACSWHGG